MLSAVPRLNSLEAISHLTYKKTVIPGAIDTVAVVQSTSLSVVPMPINCACKGVQLDLSLLFDFEILYLTKLNSKQQFQKKSKMFCFKGFKMLKLKC